MVDAKPSYAVCVVKGDNITGTISFIQSGETTKITARVKGLPAGNHGFHVHEFGNLSNGCTTAGGHFNPFGKTHGGPADEERHVGDLGNIVSTGAGNETVYEVEDKLIKLTGEHSVVGRSIVIHADEDDLGRGGHDDSKTTGHAGARICCGVIGLSGAL
mmetsp:Transcript_24186/g.27400  ORF Transcript_24186/g.27400 Transcript_24186/m.27400 type:complete len:159 (+) Transcript_24186:96-572(+)